MKKAGFLTLFLFSCIILNAQQLPNASFENWDILTDSSPHDDKATDWNTINSELDAFTAGTLSPTCYQSIDAHSGTYSTMLETVNPPLPTFPVVNGIKTTGSINTSTYEVEGGLPFAFRPDSLEGWYQCNPQSGDFPTIELVLKDAAGDTLGWARWEGPTTAVNTWTHFVVPVDWTSAATPTEAVCLLSASDGFNAVAGSQLWVDDLNVIYNASSVPEIEETFSMTYAQGNLSWTSSNKINKIDVRDMNGKLVQSKDNLTTTQLELLNLTTGVYVISFTSDKGTRTEKLSIR